MIYILEKDPGKFQAILHGGLALKDKKQSSSQPSR